MRDPMYQQGNQSPPYHNQGQQFSLYEDNYEQAKEATDFSQSGSSKDEPVGKNFQEKKDFHAFLNFDGASKGNPGLAGAGAVLRAVDGSVVYQLREGLGFATNNVAEYRGVILGLEYVLEKGFKHIQVQGDSKLVCMQYYNLPSAMGDLILEQLCRSTVGQMVLGGLLMLKWDNRIFRESGKTTNQNMVELSKTVEELKDQLMSFHIIHVERELNTEADMLANLEVLLNRMLAFADGETQVEST